MFGGLYSTLFTLGLMAAKFLAFKAVLVGKVALVLAAVAALTRIFGQNRPPQAYYGYEHVERSLGDNLVYKSISGN